MFVVVLSKKGDAFVILKDSTPESLEYVNKIHLMTEEDDSNNNPPPFNFTISPL